MNHLSDTVFEFGVKREVRTKSVHLRDYDFRRPNMSLNARHAVDGERAVTLAPSLDAQRLQSYEHHGEYEEPEIQETLARTRVEQLRARAKVAGGASTCRRSRRGHDSSSSASSRARARGFGREWALWRVRHQGHTPELVGRTELAPVYRNTFECVPADVPSRPQVRPRTLQQVLESATVVGPAGEEIFVDGNGRIKVQFHWDREGERNERSSCWIRVMQRGPGATGLPVHPAHRHGGAGQLSRRRRGPTRGDGLRVQRHPPDCVPAPRREVEERDPHAIDARRQRLQRAQLRGRGRRRAHPRAGTA